MELNDLTYQIRGAIYKVHSFLGPGLFESVYETTLIYELMEMNLNVKSQLGLPVHYNDIVLELGFRIDILVEDQIIIEIKSVTELKDVHKKQMTTYLKLSSMKVGILVNFNVSSLVDKVSLFRIIK